MWRMLQSPKAEDFVLATGETHTVREFADLSFKELGIELKWEGEGAKEKGIDKKTKKVLVDIDPRHYRPTEVELLIGDPTKAKEKLGWVARTKFQELVKIMVKADFEKISKRGY
jgi:GDPmannose 4,6-dehydratase